MSYDGGGYSQKMNIKKFIRYVGMGCISFFLTALPATMWVVTFTVPSHNGQTFGAGLVAVLLSLLAMVVIFAIIDEAMKKEN